MARFLKSGYLSILIIAAVGLAAYANSFDVPFQFDDAINIKDNPILRDSGYFLHPTQARDLGRYELFISRYIGYITFALDYRIHGTSPQGYHAFNLFVHIANAAMLCLLIRAIGRTPGFGEAAGLDAYALAAGVVFVTHPLNTQAVTYVVQRFTSLSALFCMASVLLYALGRTSARGGRALYAAALLTAALAMKTKENAVVLPVLIVLYELLFLEGPRGRRMLRTVPFFLIALIVPVTLVALKAGDGMSFGDIGKASRLATQASRTEYLLTEINVVAEYVRLSFFPVNQTVDYDVRIVTSLRGAAGAGLFLALASLAIGTVVVKAWRAAAEARVAAFGALWFAVALVPESSVFPIKDVMFEHRAYFPLMGMYLAGAALGSMAARRAGAGPGRMLAGAALIACVFTVLSLARNEVWRSEVSLWEDAVRKAPHKARPWVNLSHAYIDEALKEGDAALAGARLVRARRAVDRALEISPEDASAWNNLGAMHAAYALILTPGPREAHLREATKALGRAIDLDPTMYDAWNNLGTAFGNMGRNDKAMEMYGRAVAINPDFADVYFNMGAVQEAMGDLDGAARSFKRAIELNPADSESKERHDRLLSSEPRLKEGGGIKPAPRDRSY